MPVDVPQIESDDALFQQGPDPSEFTTGLVDQSGAALGSDTANRRSAVEPVEVDVEAVFAAFGKDLPCEDDLEGAAAGEDFGLECDVRPVSLEEQARVVPVASCPVCRNEFARPRYRIARLPYRIVDCIECGLGRLHPLPSPKMIRRFYPQSYYGVTGAKFVPLIEWLVRLVGARRVRSLSRGLSPGARVLDVGCGRGVLLSALADRGFRVHGFEIRSEAAAGADPRAAIRIGRDLQQAAYSDACFDQVIVWHVLEHLRDPRATLTEIHRILKPGGRVVVAVPNYSSFQSRLAGPAWFHLDPPRHLFHFPVTGLRRLLIETGFTPRREDHFSLRQNPFGWVQSQLNRFPRLPRNGLYTLLKSQANGTHPLNRTTSLAFRLAYWLGMPIACGLSVGEALLRNGGSVCIVAESRRD